MTDLLASHVTGRLSAALEGRYRIERHLGEGGMATVYLAADLKHERKVALKLLKPELAAVLGADRFVQEIKTTASLQHPHILPLFDSGTADGFLFYVMPFIQGETLRDKLNRETQLGVEEAVRIAREVADALDYAHRSGVIHRDIKPENILLHDGRPMVADFGIALAVSAAAGGRMTETGLSLGTPHYMSPEQATAEKEISARSDIYSIGSVLYEMLTGNPPHTGASAQQIIMKIITEPAESVTKHRRSVPENVAAAVAKSLEKLPADRFESARAFADALGNPAYTSITSGGTMAPRAGARSGRRRDIGFALAGAVAGAIAIGAWGWRVASHEERGTTARFPLTFPPDVHVNPNTDFASLAISPDGGRIVFSGLRGGNPILFSRTLGDPTPRPITGTEGGNSPFFSPDGQWLGFVALGQIKKIQLSSGTVVVVGGLRVPLDAAWMKGDVIVASANAQPALMAIPAGGGTPRVVAPLDTAHGEVFQRWPLALDDGDHLLYTSFGRASRGSSRIGVMSLAKGTAKIFDLPGIHALAVIDGTLIYVATGGMLMAVGFDARAARVTGTPVPVANEVLTTKAFGSVEAAISRSGSFVYQSGAATKQLVLSDLQGRSRPLISDVKAFKYPRLSPDGKRVAVAVSGTEGPDIWIYDIASGTPTRLTTGGRGDRPEWTPDGKRVLFTSGLNNQSGLWWQPSDGSGAAEVLQSRAGTIVYEGVVSGDGHLLIYRPNGGKVVQDLWYRRLDGDTTPKAITSTPNSEYAPRLSPDGRWLAYTSDQSGSNQIYVQPFPALGARYAITADGGDTPVWSRDGRHIYYVANEQLNVATVTTTPQFSVTSRRVLFEGTYTFASPTHATFDVAADGEHFVLVKPTSSDAQVIVAHDWKYELRERMAQAAKK